jgi:hypothetical protein
MQVCDDMWYVCDMDLLYSACYLILRIIFLQPVSHDILGGKQGKSISSQQSAISCQQSAISCQQSAVSSSNFFKFSANQVSSQ